MPMAAVVHIAPGHFCGLNYKFDNGTALEKGRAAATEIGQS